MKNPGRRWQHQIPLIIKRIEILFRKSRNYDRTGCDFRAGGIGSISDGKLYSGQTFRWGKSDVQIKTTESVDQQEATTDSADETATAASENGNVAAVAQASMPSVVAITTVSVQEIPSFFGYGSRQYKSAASGSGIIVGDNDDELLIATNNHVVEGAQR